MIEISIKIKKGEWNKIVKSFNRGIFTIYGKIRHDMRLLGEGGYEYLKTLIPISGLSHPHLRESFKIKTNIITRGVLLQIYTDIFYAPFVDSGAKVPTRFPRSKKVMRFIGPSGDVVFTKKAKGFEWGGYHFVSKTETWLMNHVKNYVDFSLRRYL